MSKASYAETSYNPMPKAQYLQSVVVHFQVLMTSLVLYVTAYNLSTRLQSSYYLNHFMGLPTTEQRKALLILGHTTKFEPRRSNIPPSSTKPAASTALNDPMIPHICPFI